MYRWLGSLGVEYRQLPHHLISPTEPQYCCMWIVMCGPLCFTTELTETYSPTTPDFYAKIIALFSLFQPRRGGGCFWHTSYDMWFCWFCSFSSNSLWHSLHCTGRVMVKLCELWWHDLPNGNRVAIHHRRITANSFAHRRQRQSFPVFVRHRHRRLPFPCLRTLACIHY